MLTQSAASLSYLTGNLYECCPAFAHSEGIVLFAAGSIVNLVSSTTGNTVGVFREHEHLVTSINVEEDGQTVLTTSIDGAVLRWNMKSLEVVRRCKVNSPVFDVVPATANKAELTLITGFGKGKNSSEKKRFSAVRYNVQEQKITRKLASLQFPRRCTGILQIPAARMRDAMGGAQSVADDGVMESILVVASARKVSFIRLGGKHSEENKDGALVPAVVHFTPDADNRRGTITCLSVGSHEDGILVTGHEKGNIVVWHNLSSYYLTAIAQEARSRRAAQTVGGGEGEGQNEREANGKSAKKHKKDKKDHKKEKYEVAEVNCSTPPLCTTLHWHAHVVHCLSLTADGTTLFSGGSEGVLVVWHNINTSSSTGSSKSFFPRLGCPISFLTNNSSAMPTTGISVAVTTTDNCVHVINTASMREDWTVRSLCVTSRQSSVPKRLEQKHTADGTASESVEPEDEHQFLGINCAAASRAEAHTLPFIQSDYYWRPTLTVEPRTQWLVCNGYPGQLQAFDRRSQSLSHAYQVADYTRVSKKETNSKMYVPSITHSQFLQHPVGNFLGTVDVRKGAELEAENSLKFWEWSDISSKYRLGAQMDNPHGPMRITALAFAGVGAGAAAANQVVSATAAVDGTVKVWRAERAEVAAQPTLSSAAKRQQLVVQGQRGAAGKVGDEETAKPLKWTCAYSFRYRDSPATSLAFSRDGSVLAVVHRNLLSFWDPSNVQLKASIVVPGSDDGENVLFTAFIEPRAAASLGGGCGEVYLFTATQTSLAVYDLLTLQLVWSQQTVGKYTAFAVAQSEDFVPTALPERAWIAVTETTAVSTDNKTDAVHKVLMFGLRSNAPLLTHVLPAKASAITYCGDTQACGRGLAIATETCEMLYLTVGDATNSSSVAQRQLAGIVGERSAQVYKVTVPGLNAGTQQEMVDTSVAAQARTAAVTATLPLSKPGWLGDIFDERSENIPSLNMISAGFFGNFRSSAAVNGGTASNTAYAASAPTASEAVTTAASKLSRKRTAEDMSGTATVAPAQAAPQQVWDEALASLFNGFAPSASGSSSSASSNAVSASAPAAEASPAVKGKKGAKKASDAVEETAPAPVTSPAISAADSAKNDKKGRKTTKTVPSTLATIAEDQELPAEPATEGAGQEVVADNKRRKVTRSGSVSSTGSASSAASVETPNSTAARASRIAVSKVPAASRAAASPSISAPAPEAAAAVAETKGANKRVLPAAASARAAKASKVAAQETAEEPAAARRSTRARSNSTMSEDSAASTGSSRRSTRSASQSETR